MHDHIVLDLNIKIFIFIVLLWSLYVTYLISVYVIMEVGNYMGAVFRIVLQDFRDIKNLVTDL